MDKAMLHECQENYMAELIPQQLGVGVKFATKLLSMGIRMTLHVKGDHVLINIDLINAYNAMWRATVMERRRGIGPCGEWYLAGERSSSPEH